MCKVNIYEAKTNLSKYVEMLESGKEEEIVITRYDKKVAKIVLYSEKKNVKRIGAGKDLMANVDYVLKSDEYGINDLFGY